MGHQLYSPGGGQSSLMVGTNTKTVDLEVGEMFYKFRLYLVLTKYFVVDLGPYPQDEKITSGTPY